MSKTKYSFLPWMRQGLATEIKEKIDHLGKEDEGSDNSAPAVDLTLNIKGNFMLGGIPVTLPKNETASKKIKLYGPGDVIGLENRSIIKTEPKNGVQHFEPNYLPYIEFYEEDFPWRYTPFAPSGERLRPWLALVVLKADEFKKDAINTKQPLPSFTVTNLDNIPFPPPYQLWAWAHVHVNGIISEANAAADLNQIVNHKPNHACTRLICPRRLEPETEYFAFLIPAFERGRLAGLGAAGELIEATDLQRAAWGHDHSIFQKQFPYYYNWSFKTTKAGYDFETLATSIEPRELHPNVGKRTIDIQAPGYNLFYDGGEFPNEGAVYMDGALRNINSNISDLLHFATKEDKAFTQDLADLINLEEDLKNPSFLGPNNKFADNPHFEDDGDSIYDDPIITPPLYGRWHAKQNKVNPEDKKNWVNQLNLDPRNRLVAGLGAEVVRRNQEDYMERAWQQFGQLFDANAFMRQAQFTLELNKGIYHKHLSPLDDSTAIRVTSNAHQSMRYRGNSLKRDMEKRNVPKGLFSPSYEKVTRPGGALMKRAGSTDGSAPAPRGNPWTPMQMIAEMNKVIDSMLDKVAVLAQGDSGTPLFTLLYLEAIPGLKSPVPGWKKLALQSNGVIGQDFLYEHVTYIHEPAHFKEGINKIYKYLRSSNWKGYNPTIQMDEGEMASQPTQDPVAVFSSVTMEKLNPRRAFTRRVRERLHNYDFNQSASNEETIEPILAAPEFKDPTYEEILKASPDAFVPNMDLIPPNTLGLLEVNRVFVESFMVGLNYEMARELLWREFPTDQRCTYFRHFWDSRVRDYKANIEQFDIEAIHRWNKTTYLGTHDSPGSVEEQLVVVIRGDLLNRYPNTAIYLQEATEDGNPGQLKELPVFEARVDPDLYFLGFNVTAEAARGLPGWFIVIEEKPGEVNFGLDSPAQTDGSPPELKSWNDFNWLHLQVVNDHIDLENGERPIPKTDNGWQWGYGEGHEADQPATGNGSAAHMACILCQQPVRLFFHAAKKLPEVIKNEDYA